MKAFSRLLFSASILPLIIAGGGCNTSKQYQLEQVAKDWCMTIRASQVIPVYPLTEDIQPGDIFLVQVPIDQQQMDYDKKGFLALDNLIARVNPNGYSNFYANSFLYTNSNATLPHAWTSLPSTNWDAAPRAAFPTYSFSVKHGEGMNLAVPIDGVPVGLSLMNSDAADGTVNIADARTIGVDTISLWKQIETWAKDNQDFLKQFTPQKSTTNYVRVITRVYACGRMDVSLRDASSKSGGLDVGAAKPVNLLFPSLSTNASANVVETYTNQLNLLQIYTNGLNALQTSLPGGSLRVAAASSRSVGLQQTFVPPLIIGYLGFDCEITGGGDLGPPIPTHAQLDSGSKINRGIPTLQVPFEGETEMISNLTAKVRQLRHQGDQNAEGTARSILVRLSIIAEPGQNLYDLLQDQIRAAALDNSKLPKLEQAFGN